jgi:hypothetical protein
MEQQELKLVDEEYRKNRFAVYVEYAFSHNKVKVGDVVSDGETSVRVEKIKVSVEHDKSECVYYGPELNKDGSNKKKRGSDRIEAGMYQRYLKQINGVSV